MRLKDRQPKLMLRGFDPDTTSHVGWTSLFLPEEKKSLFDEFVLSVPPVYRAFILEVSVVQAATVTWDEEVLYEGAWTRVDVERSFLHAGTLVVYVTLDDGYQWTLYGRGQEVPGARSLVAEVEPYGGFYYGLTEYGTVTLPTTWTDQTGLPVFENFWPREDIPADIMLFWRQNPENKHMDLLVSHYLSDNLDYWRSDEARDARNFGVSYKGYQQMAAMRLL